jgi:hypothetical protein
MAVSSYFTVGFVDFY